MQKVTSRDGTQIAYDKDGHGPAVVLVGGAFQFRGIDPRTAQLAHNLGEHFTVFHYDRRGRGDSSDKQPYAVERELEDLEALIAEAGGSACVFGMSSGGVLALDAAAAGLAITKLAVYEPPFNQQGGADAAAAYGAQLAGYLAAGRRGDAVTLAMTTFGAPSEAVAGMKQTPIWPLFESVAPTLAYDNAIMGNGAVPIDIAAQVAVPTLVLDGGYSPTWMREAADMLAHAIPHAERRTLEGQTHDVDPGILAAALAEFYSS